MLAPFDIDEAYWHLLSLRLPALRRLSLARRAALPLPSAVPYTRLMSVYSANVYSTKRRVNGIQGRVDVACHQWLDYSLLSLAKRVRSPTGHSPGLPHVGLVPDDATGRRVSSGISRFPGPCIPPLPHTQLASPSSALKTSEPPKYLHSLITNWNNPGAPLSPRTRCLWMEFRIIDNQWDTPPWELSRPRSRSEGAIRATLTRAPSALSLLRAKRAVFPFCAKICYSPILFEGKKKQSDPTTVQCLVDSRQLQNNPLVRRVNCGVGSDHGLCPVRIHPGVYLEWPRRDVQYRDENGHCVASPVLSSVAVRTKHTSEDQGLRALAPRRSSPPFPVIVSILSSCCRNPPPSGISGTIPTCDVPEH
ncbi:hypothetical protein PR048_007127 [Dryococelus australis]|uniref:Uncharacterized protein n=1 Tax=Dryococelus australis TaxID=614101 RepID=A0ABQ9IEX7_9NEOP|nr:hypothetical protein PR048_007127 [Dryococelus australis]